MVKKLILLLIIFSSIAGLFYVYLLTQESKVEDYWDVPDEGDVYICKSNDECILVANGCCNCANGGSMTSINAKYHEYWLNKKNIECGEIACLAMYNCKGETPRCSEGKCEVYIPQDL